MVAIRDLYKVPDVLRVPKVSAGNKIGLTANNVFVTFSN
jgi:hypothetical protein